MDEGSGSEFPAPGLPHGLAMRRPPAAARGFWCEVTPLAGGCIGVAIGLHIGSDIPVRSASAVSDALRRGHDPVEALSAVAPSAGQALCAVIDRPASRVSVSSVGDLAPVIAGPGVGHRTVRCPPGCLTTADLSPGDSMLLCTAAPGRSGALLDACTTAHPCDALDRIVGDLTSAADRDGPAAVIYRHPPTPLEMSLPAEPYHLATMRNELRQWLALAGVDAADCADALLAVGEAASNAAEHAVVGVAHEVRLSIHASVGDGRLRFMVSDNGRWKPARDFPGDRGHGIELINALVDAADVTTGENGTTVSMLKEMRP